MPDETLQKGSKSQRKKPAEPSSAPQAALVEANKDAEQAPDMGIRLVDTVSEQMQVLIDAYFPGITTKRGQPKRELVKEVVPKLTKLGMTQANIARVFEFAPSMISDMKRDDEQFEAAIEYAKQEPIDLIENVCFLNALRSAVNPKYQTSMIFYLKNRRPRKWRDVQDIRRVDEYAEMADRLPMSKLMQLIKISKTEITSVTVEELQKQLPAVVEEEEHQTSYDAPEDAENGQG